MAAQDSGRSGNGRLETNEAVKWAEAHGSKWDFEKDQVRVFGKLLGVVPEKRAATNGIILRHGYIVAEFGDIKSNDPVYSAAKSFLSTAASIAVAKGLIRSVDDRVADYVHDGGYDSPHNAKVTWKNHLQQESEWEGEMWGKNANFLGVEEFGSGRGSHARSTIRDVLRVQRRTHQPVRAFAGAGLRQRAYPQCSKRTSWTKSALPTNGSGMVMVRNRP